MTEPSGILKKAFVWSLCQTDSSGKTPFMEAISEGGNGMRQWNLAYMLFAFASTVMKQEQEQEQQEQQEQQQQQEQEQQEGSGGKKTKRRKKTKTKTKTTTTTNSTTNHQHHHPPLNRMSKEVWFLTEDMSLEYNLKQEELSLPQWEKEPKKKRTGSKTHGPPPSGVLFVENILSRVDLKTMYVNAFAGTDHLGDSAFDVLFTEVANPPKNSCTNPNCQTCMPVRLQKLYMTAKELFVPISQLPLLKTALQGEPVLDRAIRLMHQDDHEEDRVVRTPPRCPGGFSMVLSDSSHDCRYQNDFTCDSCKREYNCTPSPRWYCSHCQRDYCFSCAIGPPHKTNMTPKNMKERQEALVSLFGNPLLIQDAFMPQEDSTDAALDQFVYRLLSTDEPCVVEGIYGGIQNIIGNFDWRKHWQEYSNKQ